MTGRGTDRKGKKDAKGAGGANDINETALATFTLPDSLPCSEIEFPILAKSSAKVSWNKILEESENWHQQLEKYSEAKAPPIKSPFQKTECDYIQNEVFVHLIPALVETLNKAKIWQALAQQKCFFNGIDHMVQLLWNNNPRHPERKDANLHIYNMPWIRKHLQEKPRPYYPKSWLWTEEHAAILIQKTVRQYFVQRLEEVQEMREFWRKLKMEPNHPQIDMNPFLAKKFASPMLAAKRL